MRAYLRQVVDVERMAVGVDGQPVLDLHGTPTYEAPEKVRVRHENEYRETKDDNGTIQTTHHVFFCTQRLRVGDKIGGVTVKRVVEYTDGGGKVVGFEYYG